MHKYLRKPEWVLSLAIVFLTIGCGSGSGIGNGVFVIPSSANIISGGAQQFVATVKGNSNQSVVWSVQEGSPGGTVDVNGHYTAPLQTGTFHIVATSQADPTKLGTATIDVVAGAAPVITDVSPSSAPTRSFVTIVGSNFIGTTSVLFNGRAATEFSLQANGSQITARVAPGTSTGRVQVIAPGGQAVSPNDFTVVPTPPTLDSFTPGSGSVGTEVVIKGKFLTDAIVKFNGTIAFVGYNGPNQINAVVPATTTGLITIVTPDGVVNSAANFVVAPLTGPPTIASFAPIQGAVGTAVAIAGTNLSGATAAFFNGTAAAIGSDTATQLTVTVPSGASSGPISVTTPGGTAFSASNFTITTPPTITSFSPTSGAVGAAVAIFGTNLVGATAVSFNGISASFTNVSATQVNATVPSAATTGSIQVTTSAGTATSTSVFTVLATPPPTITSFQVNSAVVGTPFYVYGTNLLGATAISFNGTLASIILDAAFEIKTAVPNGATSGPISITTAVGTAISPNSFVVLPPQLNHPVVSAFLPTAGKVGTSVNILGSNLSCIEVDFNGTPALISFNSPTQLTVTVASGSTTGPISVISTTGTAVTSTNFAVLP